MLYVVRLRALVKHPGAHTRANARSPGLGWSSFGVTKESHPIGPHTVPSAPKCVQVILPSSVSVAFAVMLAVMLASPGDGSAVFMASSASSRFLLVSYGGKRMCQETMCVRACERASERTVACVRLAYLTRAIAVAIPCTA